MVVKEVKSNVTGIGSDALDSQAKQYTEPDLANRVPFRLFCVTGQQLIDGTGASPPIGQLYQSQDDAEGAEKDHKGETGHSSP